MKLTREEQETHVWGNAADSDWEIYTADPKYIRRFAKLGYQVTREDGFGKQYRVPRRAVRFFRPVKRKVTGRPGRPFEPRDRAPGGHF